MRLLIVVSNKRAIVNERGDFTIKNLEKRNSSIMVQTVR